MKTEQQKITTPEFIEIITDGGDLEFRRARLATVAEIELDLIRAVARIRVIDSDDSRKSEDAYSRVCSLSELRNQRLGRDDGWLKALIDVLLRFEAAETDTSPCSTASTSSGDPLS